jgi:hypothetical protein
MMLLVPWPDPNTCLPGRGKTTIYLRLGKFQPAKVGNFQSAQTGDFSTGTDTPGKDPAELA